METILSFLAALFALYTFPTAYLALTSIMTILAYCVTESQDAVLGVLVLMIFLRVISTILEPTVKYGAIGGPTGSISGIVETFQPKNPVNIHQRIADAKQETVKPPTISGVLESPNILSSFQIAGLANGDQGATTRSMPSSPGMYQSINTPAESFVPNAEQVDAVPMGNPLLQNGPDLAAIDTALTKTGAKLQGSGQDPASVPGVSVGSGEPTM